MMLRAAHGFIALLRVVYDESRDVPETVQEQLFWMTFMIDREAAVHTREIAVDTDTPVNPSSYGEMVSWLAWTYMLCAFRQNDPEHRDRDAAALLAHCRAFDQLAADVRAGTVQLPAKATGVLPPRTVRPASHTSDAHGEADR